MADVIGSVWATDTWADDTWIVDSWADADVGLISITAVLVADDKVYDAVNTATGTLTLVGVTPGDDVSLSTSSLTFSQVGVGTGLTVTASGLTLTGSDAALYTLSNGSATDTANITARALTLTADNKSKYYGASDPTFTVAITGGAVQGSDTASGSLTRAAGEAIGSYAITQGSYTYGSNYSETFVNGLLTIAQVLPGIYGRDDLHTRFLRYADRPDSDEDLSADDIDGYLTDAQNQIVAELAALFPRLLMGAPELMTTNDGGLTYTLGPDAEGHLIYPFGHAELYAQAANGMELYASNYGSYDGDFVFEGGKVRVPAGNTRSFASGPYIRYVALPLKVDETNEPILQPKQLRLLILYRALVLWANTGGHRDPRPFEEMYNQAWTGKHGGMLAMLTTQYRQSTNASLSGVNWWRFWKLSGGAYRG